MPVSIGLGIADIVGSVIGGIGEALVPAAAAAGAADVGAAGAIALPEIAVTAAAPEAAAFGGADLLAGGALAGTAADLAGGAGAGAFDLGLTAGAGADLAGGALAGAAPIATEGVTAVAPSLGAALGGGGVAGVGDVLAGGAATPLAALDTSPIAGDFAALSEAGIPPSTDISAALAPSPIAPDFAAIGGAGTLPDTGAITDTTALALAEPGATPANPLANIPTATDAFANAPAAVTGQAPQSAVASALGVENPLTGGTGLADVGVPTAETPTIPFAPQIPASSPTAVASATPGVTGAGTVAPDVAAAQAIGPTAAPGSLTGAGAGVSPGVGSLLSGSTLRTAATLAPLGLLGATLARGQPSLPPAEEQALANANVVGGFGASQLNMAKNNQITPAQQAQIDQYVQQAQSQVYQLYANQGGNPTQNTGYLRALELINQNAIAMRQQFITAETQNGIQAMGVADLTLQGAAQMQVANDNAFQQSIAGATESFGLIAAINATSKAA